VQTVGCVPWAMHGPDRPSPDFGRYRIIILPLRGSSAACWALLFADKHPYAGGQDHYAAYLANSGGYEAELIADSP
jgi:hypothetical protein